MEEDDVDAHQRKGVQRCELEVEVVRGRLGLGRQVGEQGRLPHCREFKC